ncbi:MAG: hypothetical protein QM785_10335 [Pyrinomonadaceae bacterium]
MKNIVLSLLIASFFFTANGQTTPRRAVAAPAAQKPNAAASLPIRRVVLYSNGVAYIERRGMVDGNAEIELPFKQSQVDDVLKSMVVLDLGQGKIGAVSYNSSAPTSSTMAEIPFSVTPVSDDGSGISSVLSQLQGASVMVTSTKGTATGSILTVERKQITSEKETRSTSVLVIASESGEISSYDLNDVKSVKLLDNGTRKDITDFATATASARRLDAKTITVTSQGVGRREMVVSYTIAAPIWKTTYRVVMDDEGKPFFQGWAIVDNVSDEDWLDVQMSLVSGSPISFIQNLQKPFYRYRPVVPTPADLQLRPQVYEPQSGISPVNGRNSGQNMSVDLDSNKDRTVLSSRDFEALPSDPDEMQRKLNALVSASAGPNGAQIYIDGFTGAQLPVAQALASGRSGISTAAKGADIGDLFEYRIEQPTTVERNRSALIPIVQAKMDGERVAVYNESVRADRPLSGVYLKNTTDLTFENGSLTVLDGNAYAGEALMERLKPKEERLISFALDLGTRITVRNGASREPSKVIKAVDGVLQFQSSRAETKTYEIANQSDRPKVLYIEFPIRKGWEPSADSPKPDSVTQNFYRYRVPLAKFEEKKFALSFEQPLLESFRLETISRDQIDLFIRNQSIDAATKAKLEALIDIRMKIAELDTKVNALSSESAQIANDQARLRENIESLAKTPEAKTLIARYIAKANDQETRIETIDKEKKALMEQKEQLRRDLAGAIKGF